MTCCIAVGQTAGEERAPVARPGANSSQQLTPESGRLWAQNRNVKYRRTLQPLKAPGARPKRAKCPRLSFSWLFGWCRALAAPGSLSHPLSPYSTCLSALVCVKEPSRGRRSLLLIDFAVMVDLKGKTLYEALGVDSTATQARSECSNCSTEQQQCCHSRPKAPKGSWSRCCLSNMRSEPSACAGRHPQGLP